MLAYDIFMLQTVLFFFNDLTSQLEIFLEMPGPGHQVQDIRSRTSGPVHLTDPAHILSYHTLFQCSITD